MVHGRWIGRRHRPQRDGECGAPIFAITRNGNIAVVCYDHCLRNGKSKAETAVTAGNRALALLEGVKDLVDLIRLDADSG